MTSERRDGTDRSAWATSLLLALAVVTVLTVSGTAALAASPWEEANLVGQGPDGPVVSPGRAEIHRTANGVTAKISMPTPDPGSYAYPQGPTASGIPGHPEAFSLWVFVFFNPEACVGECDGPDLQSPDPAVIAGAFNAGGHLEGGPNLTIAGRANQQSTVFGGPNAESIGDALSLGHNIAGAEIHLAVAPHGALDPDLLPEAIQTPVGNPTFWWLAFFK